MSTSSNEPLAAPRLWDMVCDGYSQEIAPHLAKYAKDALRLARVQPGVHIADVACGPGMLSLMAAREGIRVSALDFSSQMVARLCEVSLREGLHNIEARTGDGMALPYTDQSVDAAFSMFGLLFFADRHRGFRELLRILKPNGRAVVGSWVSMDRVPMLNDIYSAFRNVFPDMPFGGAKTPLSNSAECCAEMTAAGFRKAESIEIDHALEAPSVEEFFKVLSRSTPPIHAIREALGPKQWSKAVKQLLTRLHAKWGTGPQVVSMPAYLTIGWR